MLTIVAGGSASGKSEYAEGLLPKGGVYLATMRPLDSEARARIARHQLMRASKGFTTIECYTDLSSIIIPQGGDVLLECIGNLTANELFGGAGDGTVSAVVTGVERLVETCNNVVVVTNDVFSGGGDYGTETVKYMRILGEINRKLANMADNVIEVVCGVPVYHKGAER